LTASPDASLSKDLPQDSFCGALRYSNLAGDCLVSQTIQNSFEHLLLALCQQAVQVPILAFRNGAGQKLEDCQVDPGFSRRDLPDRSRETIQRAVLPEYAGGAGA
jgi:hypothetical protein